MVVQRCLFVLFFALLFVFSGFRLFFRWVGWVGCVVEHEGAASFWETASCAGQNGTHPPGGWGGVVPPFLPGIPHSEHVLKHV